MDRHPYILALDLAATKTGVAEGPAGSKPWLYTLAFSRKYDEPEDTGGRAMEWFSAHLEEVNPDLVIIEAPMSPGTPGFTTNANTTILLIGLWFAFASECKARGFRYRKANVQSARQDFIGARYVPMPKGSKQGEGGDEAKRRVFEMCKLLGWSPTDQNSSDAGACWFRGCKLIAPNLLPVITPMMCDRVKTPGVGLDAGADPEKFFKKASAA